MELMTAAPADRAGSAAGIDETSAEFGIALGVALLGSGAVTAGYAISSILAAAVFVALAVGALLFARRQSASGTSRPEATGTSQNASRTTTARFSRTTSRRTT